MGMPVALLKRSHILLLRQALTKVEHVQKSYYVFQMRQEIGDAGYETWRKSLNIED